MDAKERAETVKSALSKAWRDKTDATLMQRRRELTLHLDAEPALIVNKMGAVVGIDAMVRLFSAQGDELPVDPHRVCINPPTQIVVKDTEHDAAGNVVNERILRPAPEEAYWEWLWQSVTEVPNERGWRTRGTVTTVFATAPGGEGAVGSSSTVYATARTGGTLGGLTRHNVGQDLQVADYFTLEAFCIFDTSAIDDADTVSGVVLSIDGRTDNSVTDFVVTAASTAYNGGPVVTSDFVSGADLAALTTYATFDSSGYSSTYNAFTSAGAAFNSAINKTGNTVLMLYSDRHSAGTTPTGGESITFEDADAAGTTADPKLDITHEAAAATGVTWFQSKGKWW